ncbi:hypothetical protein OKW41_006967 [Paraburkholderia sp. UCT70]|uniref:hypothetical protein n=1 Tax=Paraburkholderia sp. UCT70 TaxID=2991068 RepID=UPI003D1C64FE
MNVFFFLGAVLLYTAWGALVLLGKTDPNGYVVAIAAGLTFLGKHVSSGRGATDKSVQPAPIGGYTPTAADGATLPPPPAPTAGAPALQ